MRLRVPAALAFFNALALGYIWFVSDLMRQVQVMASIGLLALSGLLLFVWFVLLSGAPGRARLGVAAAVALIGIAGAGLFRVRGVTGDLMPIVEYRFAAPRVLPEAQSRPEDRAPAPSTTDATLAVSPAPLVEAETKSQPGTATADSKATAALPAGEPAAKNHQDWPQYLGPARSGVVPDANLDTDWAARPPKLLWRQPVGAGWAGFAVSGEIAVTQEQRGDEEQILAYDLRTGRPLWSHRDKALHDSPLGGVGPRGVPAIDGGQVFAQGATGVLNALDLRTGRRLWSRNILKDNNGVEPEWGVAISPLVHGGRVIVAAGGKPDKALVAYDRNTGESAWTAGSSGLAYSSPVVMTLGGREQIVVLNKDSAAGHDPQSGALLWTQPMPGEQPTVAQPLALSASRVLFSIGYGVGSKVFEVAQAAEAGLSSKLVWSSPRLKSKFANMVLFEGSVYGLDDGVFVCLDPDTGERRWKAGRFGHGQLILVGRRLLLQTEQGEVLIVEPNPERLIEVARFQALEGKTWNPPAFAAPILLVRNDLEAAAYELPARR
ncbi:MAG TPA: PQQ-like beta-propeller repeat protein [Vicinamibacteria bacterium]|nr:PQQ-like beta-propeller repeat protein [Vicinamibacteria bacterium]